MSVQYLYGFSSTSNGEVNVSILRQEILDDPLPIPGLEEVSADWGTQIIAVQFSATLSTSEKSALDAVVAAHVGVDFAPSEQSASDPSVQDTSGSNPLTALSTGGIGPALPTSYRIYLYCEHCLSAPVAGGISTVTLELNGSEVASDVYQDGDDWHAFAVLLEVDCLAGDNPTLDVILTQSGAASTARIRRIQLDFEVIEG